TFPPLMGILFTLFCTFMGGFGLFWSDTRTFVFDKTKNQVSLKINKLLKHTKRQYSFNEVGVKVKRTSRERKVSSIRMDSNGIRVDLHSLINQTNRKETVFVVVLQIASNSQEIYISGNYALGTNRNFNRNEAVEFAQVIRDFINTP
ncbi:MAG: hypothetical protein SAJ37_12880, partial [Oscillatoria sp. PMC 1068.18]|nr:hypothetical protein [Oscillatoria sp. PMC 1068.18]